MHVPGCADGSLTLKIPFITKRLEEKRIIYQNKLLEKHLQEVQNIYTTMREWRHDYHNHLQAMKAYVKMGQVERLNDYLELLEEDLKDINQLIDSGNVNLDAVLNSKISLAIHNGIKVEYKAVCPKELQVRDIDLCALIGNLLDNAMEACEKVKENNPYIRIYIGIIKKQLYISVANSTNETIRRLNSEWITGKRGNHGHGLRRIDHVVKKYQGYINRQNEPGVFVTEVMLPM